MMGWLRSLRLGHPSRQGAISDPLWSAALARYPFLNDLSASELRGLRTMALEFLGTKEFHGAAGLQISDEMAVAIAAQACLPVLHVRSPYRGVAWYDDFVGIVVHPGPVKASRQDTDQNGVVHCYDEVLSGEAMQDGPVTLSWQDVADAGRSASDGYNVVIHEFVHKIDMRDGQADGCPPLPAGFMGAPTAAGARRTWIEAMQRHYLGFCDQCSLAERFGAAAPWLDTYGASSIDEFFAVSSEAYFVNRDRFARDFADLLPLMDAFFRPDLPTT